MIMMNELISVNIITLFCKLRLNSHLVETLFDLADTERGIGILGGLDCKDFNGPVPGLPNPRPNSIIARAEVAVPSKSQG